MSVLTPEVVLALVQETFMRLEDQVPDNEWEYTGNFLVYSETLWLQFSTAVERRMYWVKAEDGVNGVLMAWSLSEVPDIV
jgi:hypothetical protein